MDIAAVFHTVQQTVRSGSSIGRSIDKIITICEQAHPHADWQLLRELPYDDLSELREWIRRPFLREPPPDTIRGLWFGIFNPVYDKKPTADLYVCGSNRFEADELDCGWAVGPDWWPEDRYSESSIMSEIYRVAYVKNGLGNDAEYPMCLAFAALAVRDLLTEIDRELVAFTIPVGVAVGFDSGDFILLGQLDANGLSH